MTILEILTEEKSFSVESGDGWYILYRAHLHLANHGTTFGTAALDGGDMRAQVGLLLCRRMIRAEQEVKRATA